MTRSTLGLILCLFGALLIALRTWGAQHAARIYRSMGFQITDAQYARQFMIVGILLFLLGVVVGLGLI